MSPNEDAAVLSSDPEPDSVPTDVINETSVEAGPDIDLNVNGGDPEPEEED